MRIKRRFIGWTAGAVFALHIAAAALAACTARDHEVVTREASALQAPGPAPSSVHGAGGGEANATALDSFKYRPDERYLPGASAASEGK